MSSVVPRTGTWDEASSPAATRLARRFEDAWRASKPHGRPDPARVLALAPDASPAAVLALLRVDLNLRWDDGVAVRVEEYRRRFSDLNADTLVALCYEEFCRREEDGLTPFPSEYDERFPDLADRLRRVFDIHELVGNAASTDLPGLGSTASLGRSVGGSRHDGPDFPEVTQTIAGFHLVEELGRGSFARVFLARERQLADRPVALKIARGGSREPQTLARLQHTHIVPVHSYRVDPATGLHLLCMPYFGRVTLAQLLTLPSVASTPTGAGLLVGLDALEPGERRAEGPATLSPTSARATLTRLSFARAMAWWGARLAEALGHAHDRGILHRDIKPSNVLVTSDGLPMLLDFNLAGESWTSRHGSAPENLGGTLAYMAPEHLEAVARGEDDEVDGRSDIYSLGVLLFEALVGLRPFAPPTGATSLPDALRRAADDRRGTPPSLRADHPEVPEALERVIRRCLAPDPAARYPVAAELAGDLQAVADDSPLRWTREPIRVRAVRRIRRSWRRYVVAAAFIGGATTLATNAVREGGERAKLARDAKRELDQGRADSQLGEFGAAIREFQHVGQLARDRPELRGLMLQATASSAEVRYSMQVRAEADALDAASLALKARLFDPAEPLGPTLGDLRRALASFRVFEDGAWAQAPILTFLDAPRRVRLIRTVDELLYLLVARFRPDDPSEAHQALAFCDRRLAGPDRPKVWVALRDSFDRSTPAIHSGPTITEEPTGCFEWSVRLSLNHDTASSRTWLGRAVTLAADDPWYHLALAMVLTRQGSTVEALGQFEAAVALRPRDPTIRQARARLYRRLGDATLAEFDERQARSTGAPQPR